MPILIRIFRLFFVLTGEGTRGRFSISVIVNYEGITCYSVDSIPSSPNTLPPFTMGFGRRGTGAVILD